LSSLVVSKRCANTGGDRAGPTVLAHLLETTKDDNAVIMEIYLRCLAREPEARHADAAALEAALAEVGRRLAADTSAAFSAGGVRGC